MAVRRALGLYTSRLAALAEAKRTPEQAKRANGNQRRRRRGRSPLIRLANRPLTPSRPASIFTTQKTYAHVTVEDVEKYLLSKVFEDPDDIKTRKLLVNTFIRDILWYGDHMVITYNFQEYAVTDRFCKSYVEQLEKQAGEASRAASSFSLCSYKFRHSAPKRVALCGSFFAASTSIIGKRREKAEKKRLFQKKCAPMAGRGRG